MSALLSVVSGKISNEVLSNNAVKVSPPPSCLSYHYFWPWLVALCTSASARPFWPCFSSSPVRSSHLYVSLEDDAGEKSNPDVEDGCRGVDRWRRKSCQ